MKKQLHKNYLLVLLLLAISSIVRAQALTGTRTIPGNYASISLAVSALNASGVGAGGVVFNVAAGYTETLTAPIVLTATGTLANPIVFQKSGVGANPRITAFVGSQNANLNTGIDVMWSLLGSDFVTISQIDLQESAANLSPITMMETGYGLYKANGSNGCNNNTIQNCTITLNRNNIFINGASGARALAGGSVGIEMLACTPTAIGTVITVLNTAGVSSNNRFYGNTIQNCNFGISLSGFAAPAPYTLGDANNDIGGNSTLTGNNILNFGGGVGAYSQCGAVLINSQWGSKIQYNTINNNTGAGVNHPVSNRGIWLFNSSPGASCDINFNKLTIKGSGAPGSSTINWMVNVEMGQTGANGNTINVNNNQFLNCTYLNNTSGAFTAVWLNTAATNVNVNNNYVYGYTYAGTSTNPNAIILSQLAGIANLNVNNNIIDSLTLTGGAGTFNPIAITAATTVGVNINNNSITRLSLNTAGAGSQTINGIINSGASPFVNVFDNTINNITRNGSIGGNTVGILTSLGTLQTVKRNTVSNITQSGQGTTSVLFGIQTTTGTIVCDSNTVFNLAVNKVTGTGVLYGIYNIAAPTNENYNYNTIYNLSHIGNAVVYGLANLGTIVGGARNISYNTIYNLSGNSTVTGIQQASSVPRIFNNKIYDLTTNGATSVVSGIAQISSTAGTCQIFNNVIGGLFAPLSNGGAAATVIGINLRNATALTTIGLYNNTISLAATSTGTNFSSAGIFHTYSITATTAALDMRNNIIVNNSIPRGTGITSALRRSASTDLNNFNALSNRNLFYAGVPSASNVIYQDGTNLDQTLSAYRTRVLPRDSASFSEVVNFISTVGSSASFLKVAPSIPTSIEGSARNIAGITNDFENNVRAGNPGYTGASGAPDIGAFENNYIGNATVQMFLDSSTAEQRFGVVAPSTANVAAVRVRMHTQMGFNPLTVSSFRLNTTGGTTPADVLNARIYYTGSDSTFTNPILFGTTLTPSGAFTLTGSRTLATGINYFWVTYDMSATATNNNQLDVRVDSIVVNGVNTALLVNDPIGNRTIRTRLNGNYNVGSGQPYLRITDALADLTSVGVSGPVTFTLTDALYNTAATGEVFPLTISSYPGASSVNRVTIRPNTGISTRIEANNATAVVDLNGVRFFTIDGRQGGIGGFTSGNNLVITNLGTAAPTVRFINEASQNSLLYVDVRGGSITSQVISSGVINIATTTGLNGNDSNIIRYCDIHEEGFNLPLVGISSIGTATTLATNNDGNIIDSCNIYNTFGAASGYAGVYVGANNNAWRITANRFYQTATRTSTSTQTHRAIWVTPNTANLTSASGFVISNNFIGGSASNGTGVTTLAGTTGYFFTAMDLSVGLGTATSVQNNTITNLNITSGAATPVGFAGIALSNGNIDCGTVTGNLIGSRTTNGSITYTVVTSTAGGGITAIRTGGGTFNTFNISNNIISGIDVVGNATLISPDCWGMNLAGGTFVNVNNNMIGDTALANSINVTTTSATSLYKQVLLGIFVSSGGANNIYNVTNNTIANLNNNHSATGTQVAGTKGIWVTPTAGGWFNITGNTIKNISSAVQTTNTGSNVALCGICVSSTIGHISVTQNRVSGLTLTGSSTTAAVIATGITYASSTTGVNDVKNNIVHGLNLTALNPFATLNGIEIASGNGFVYNNIVRLGVDTLGNDIVTPLSIRGIGKGSGSNSIYHNSVYIGGAGVGSSSSRTFAFSRTAVGVDDVRNNIFTNMRANSAFGGGHIPVSINNNTTLVLDNNIYNYNIATDTLGLLNNIGYTTLNSWKNNASRDFISAVGNPNFINATGSSSALNMRLTGTTPAESFASPIGVTTDFEGDARNTNTPDIGADEGTFVAIDLASPNIVFTALANDTTTGNRILTATITDATGVYRTGALQPRIYFRKYIAGTLLSTQGAFVSGTSVNGTWNFTIDATLMGGLTVGDSVYYFVVAQDSSVANNLGSFPAGAEGSNVNTLLVNPIQNSNYRVIPRINGLLTVGVGQTFTTLTGADGLFNYLNNSFIANNITVQVVSDIEEPGTVGLNQLNQGNGTFSVSIVPDAATLRNITGTTTTSGAGLITLNGADRIKIDGSFGGSGRFLRFMNRSKIGGTINFTNDADLDTISSCIIEGVDTIVGIGSILAPLASFGTINFQTAGLGGTGNDSNVIMNCIIRDTLGSSILSAALSRSKPDKAIYSNGTNNFSNDNNSIIGCELFNFLSNGLVTNTGGGDNWMVYNNSFYNLFDSNTTASPNNFIAFNSGNGQIIRRNSLGGKASDRSGIAYQINNSQTNRILFLSVGSAVPSIVDSNIISNIAHLNTGGGGLYLISSTGAALIRANTIGGGQNPWDTLSGSAVFSGMLVSGTSAAAVVEVSNNTVGNLYNRNVGTGQVNAAIFASAGNFVIKNNIVRDFFFNATAALSMAANSGGPIGIYVSPAANELDTVQGNIITNMNATLGNKAIGILLSTSSNNNIYIGQNRITNIIAGNPALKNASAIGIATQTLSGTNSIVNNQITLGANTSHRVFGIHNGQTSGTNSYNNNTILITGQGDSTSYGIFNGGIGGFVNATNNLVYNKRINVAGSTARHTAFGGVSNIANTSLNYNLSIVNDTALVFDSVNVSKGWASLNSLSTTTYNTNWAERNSVVLAENLFTDTTNGNLSIITTNPEAWYANGKGIRIIGQTGDFNAPSGVRSGSIPTGPVDIGSVEFTTTSVPPLAFADKVPVANDSTQFIFASRVVAKANWGVIGVLPTTVDVRYYSGVNPPNTSAGRTMMNAYWTMAQTGGSGYVYDLSLLQDSAVLGTVANVANLRTARYSGTGNVWTNFPTSAANNVTGLLVANGLTQFGTFTGTDISNNPLPVKLTSFTANVESNDVLLRWTTASEQNNQGFEVERSVDGKVFEQVGFVKGAGSSNEVTSYRLLDNEAFAKTNANVLYYRLKQVDVDGKETYSTIVSVNINTENTNSMSVYPNPFTTDYAISLTANADAKATVELFNIQGKQVNVQTKNITKGFNVLQVTNIEALHSGIYFVKVTINGETQVMKLVKN